MASRNSAVHILRGLMSQLIQQHPELLSCLLSTWKIQQDTLFSSFETLWRIFHQMLEALVGDEVRCVLDALDECDEQSLTSLLCKITESYNSPTSLPLKLIITSREEPKAIQQALAKHPRIPLEHIDKDIRLYIAQKVCNLARIKMIHGSPLQHRIMEAFREGAEGTLLWVSYMAHELETKSLSEIELARTQLPQGLYEIYERIMSQIRVGNRDKIADMLMWISFAKRPLRINELCEAIHVQASAALTQEEVCFDYIRSCGHLLQLLELDSGFWTWVPCLPHDENPPYLSTTFLHQSAKDLLLRTDAKRLSLPITTHSEEAHLRILDRLLEILELHFCDGNTPHVDVIMMTPLLHYAILCLDDHMSQLGEGLELILPKHEAFFAKASKVRGAWYSQLFRRSAVNEIPLLHLACDLGLYWLAKLYLERKGILSLLGHYRKISQKWGQNEETPPHLAVRDWSLDIIQLLLSCGADVTRKDLRGRTPLHCAIVYSTLEVYKLLSSSKRSSKVYRQEAKQYIQNNNKLATEQESLLHLAAQYGWEDLCQDPIQHHNYDIDWEAGPCKRPIHLALERGHISLAKRAVTEWGACLTPDIQVLKALLRPANDLPEGLLEEALRTYTNHWGCGINAVDAEGRTILYDDRLNVLRSITNAGLPINFNHQDNQHQTVLHCGGYWLEDPLLLKTFLLKSQFDANPRDSQGCTPLHCATRRALSSVHVHPRKSASQNSSSNPDGCEAERHFHEEESRRIQLLLDFGADRSLLDKEGWSFIELIRKERDLVPDCIREILMNYSTVAINAREIRMTSQDDTWPWVY